MMDVKEVNAVLRSGLNLIKKHITADETAQNRELTQGIALIVDAARKAGLLLTPECLFVGIGIPAEANGRFPFDINFKVGRKLRCWTRFYETLEAAKEDAPVVRSEYPNAVLLSVNPHYQ